MPPQTRSMTRRRKFSQFYKTAPIEILKIIFDFIPVSFMCISPYMARRSLVYSMFLKYVDNMPTIRLIGTKMHMIYFFNWLKQTSYSF